MAFFSPTSRPPTVLRSPLCSLSLLPVLCPWASLLSVLSSFWVLFFPAGCTLMCWDGLGGLRWSSPPLSHIYGVVPVSIIDIFEEWRSLGSLVSRGLGRVRGEQKAPSNAALKSSLPRGVPIVPGKIGGCEETVCRYYARARRLELLRCGWRKKC